MPHTVVILVRIAVRVPEKSFSPLASRDPECQVCPGPCPIEKPSVAPLVTAEMVVFFHKHPDNN